MDVFIIGDAPRRADALRKALTDQSIPSACITSSGITLKTKGIYVFFSPKTAASLNGKFKKLLANGSLVITLWNKKNTVESIPGILSLTFDVTDSVLLSLISWFLKWKEKEAHYNRITDELQKMNRSLSEEASRLKQTRDELDLKNKKIKEQLALANIIQNSFLPKQFPVAFPISFSYKYIPHEYIGGDFFEVLQIDEDHLGILIADVSGHGVSSALITAMLKSSFAHAARDCLSPGAVLSTINKEFTQTMRTEQYITAFYLIIDTVHYTSRFANAGHPHQLILRLNGGIDSIGANGFFLGMFEHTRYEEETVPLHPGDRLVFFTDGIIECPDLSGKHFGKQKLIDLLDMHRADDIETLSKNVVIELISYMADFRFPDDITLLIAEIIPLL